MSRPRCCRQIACMPQCVLFKPSGIPASFLEEITLALDELEALRLADLDGLYHEAAAERMKVSRQTFGRTLEVARRKVAQVLVQGKALRIEGGEVAIGEMRTFQCQECRRQWEAPFGGGRPAACPSCKSANIHRSEEEEGVPRKCCRRAQARQAGSKTGEGTGDSK